MHVNQLVCQKCRDMLSQCDPKVEDLYNFIKAKHVDAHVAVGFRDEAAQTAAVQAKLSKDPWPQSKHNHSENGRPCSLAIDVFQLGTDGKAHFDVPYYEKIWSEIQTSDLKIRWGGTFVHLKDYDHFELITT